MCLCVHQMVVFFNSLLPQYEYEIENRTPSYSKKISNLLQLMFEKLQAAAIEHFRKALLFLHP